MISYKYHRQWRISWAQPAGSNTGIHLQHTPHLLSPLDPFRMAGAASRCHYYLVIFISHFIHGDISDIPLCHHMFLWHTRSLPWSLFSCRSEINCKAQVHCSPWHGAKRLVGEQHATYIQCINFVYIYVRISQISIYIYVTYTMHTSYILYIFCTYKS